MQLITRRLAALFILGLIAFYSPVLVALNRDGTLWGLPLLPTYLFLVWTALVFWAWLATRSWRR